MKVPVIKDVRSFLSVAQIYGYVFKNNYCIKTVIFDYQGYVIEIKINLLNGRIGFIFWNNSISDNSLSLDDKRYLLKDIDYLVKWINIDCLEG